MEKKQLGATGLKVSPLAFGCSSYGSSDWMPWALSEEDAQEHYKKAFEVGFSFFDTADSYSTGLSEEILGRALKRFGPGRDRVVIATKVFGATGPDVNQRGLSRKHIRHAIDDSLRRLGTDYVDLYQIHRLDPDTPWEELLLALDDVVRAGKALYLGASSMHAWQFAKLQALAKQNGLTPFVSMQNKYNLLYREEEREMLPLCASDGIAVIPYSPLARGLLAGSRRNDTARSKVVRDFTRPQDENVIDRVVSLAQQKQVKPAQIALAWLAGSPTVTAPIIGATKLHHIDDAVAALDIRLLADERAYLEEPYIPQQVQLDRNEAIVAGQTASADVLALIR
ncbi:aldo/keto reductase [Agrobacterium vitis]|uniref:aldo/keto reductase n=1 Tax=Agrobacterium vitis TaxID=373 RepID=UPI001F37D0AF|nr:aldo/keto reductase [Agrobacterium vitis]MCE6076422.1 aldo/keto reductase [Agrobacterium vitis]